MVIGQAFSAAYKQFLRSSGISDQQLVEAEYAHILSAQSVPQLEVESLGDRNKIKKVSWSCCRGQADLNAASNHLHANRGSGFRCLSVSG